MEPSPSRNVTLLLSRSLFRLIVTIEGVVRSDKDHNKYEIGSEKLTIKKAFIKAKNSYVLIESS